MNSKAQMPMLEHEAYLKLREGARVIEADGYGDKVLLLPDDTYLKLFRRKRLVSSAAIRPYAQRFVDNTVALARRGIPCPQVIQAYRIPSIDRTAVHYRPLAGRTLRQLIAAGLPEDQAEELRLRLLRFIDHLHACGIYFRSAHLGNIVLTPNGDFGLIDVADLKVTWCRIGPLRRRRNLRHILRYTADLDWLSRSPAWRRLIA